MRVANCLGLFLSSKRRGSRARLSSMTRFQVGRALAICKARVGMTLSTFDRNGSPPLKKKLAARRLGFESHSCAIVRAIDVFPAPAPLFNHMTGAVLGDGPRAQSMMRSSRDLRVPSKQPARVSLSSESYVAPAADRSRSLSPSPEYSLSVSSNLKGRKAHRSEGLGYLSWSWVPYL